MHTTIFPFSFSQHQRPLKSPWYWVVIANVMVIACGFYMLGSQLLTAPGLSMDLPQSQGQLKGVSVSKVITIAQPNMIFADNAIYTLEAFQKKFATHSTQDVSKDIILIKVNATIDMQTFFTVCDALQNIGYTRIQIAAEESVPSAYWIDAHSL